MDNKRKAIEAVQRMLGLEPADLRKEVGKKILSRDRRKEGVVTKIVYRSCAVCGYGPAYSVKWEDGRRTFPCTKACEHADGVIHIV